MGLLYGGWREFEAYERSGNTGLSSRETMMGCKLHSIARVAILKLVVKTITRSYHMIEITWIYSIVAILSRIVGTLFIPLGVNAKPCG